MIFQINFVDALPMRLCSVSIASHVAPQVATPTAIEVVMEFCDECWSEWNESPIIIDSSESMIEK